MAFLCRNDRVLFTGDAVNADTFLLEMNRAELAAYADRLDALAVRVGDEGTTVYAGHLNRGQTFRTILNLAEACREVSRGETYGDPPGMSVYVNAEERPSRRLHYHGNTCVVYDRAAFND